MNTTDNIEGYFLIDKPKGMTSRDVVNIVSKQFNTRKVGHNGTLDPNATGLLVIGINSGCKLINLMEGKTKKYVAEVIFGISTDTLDITGTILDKCDVDSINVLELDNTLQKLVGTYNRAVPKFSACKVNGKKLYEYARNNESVELPVKEVTVFSLNRISEPKHVNNHMSVFVECEVSAGTYVRNIIEDIGIILDIPTTMGDLCRTKNGKFNIEQAITLEQLNNNEYSCLSIVDAFDFEVIELSDENLKRVLNGNKVYYDINTEYCILTSSGEAIAVYKKSDQVENELVAFKVLKN